MRTHAVPQEIMSMEFKLFGNFMSLREFLFIAVGIGAAYFIYFLMRQGLLPPLLAWPVVLVVGIGGILTGLVPIQERSIDTWIVNYFNAIAKPTQRIWKKKGFEIPMPQTGTVTVKDHVIAPPSTQKKSVIGSSEIPVQAATKNALAPEERKKLEQDEIQRLREIEKTLQESTVISLPKQTETQSPNSPQAQMRTAQIVGYQENAKATTFQEEYIAPITSQTMPAPTIPKIPVQSGIATPIMPNSNQNPKDFLQRLPTYDINNRTNTSNNPNLNNKSVNIPTNTYNPNNNIPANSNSNTNITGNPNPAIWSNQPSTGPNTSINPNPAQQNSGTAPNGNMPNIPLSQQQINDNPQTPRPIPQNNPANQGSNPTIPTSPNLSSNSNIPNIQNQPRPQSPQTQPVQQPMQSPPNQIPSIQQAAPQINPQNTPSQGSIPLNQQSTATPTNQLQELAQTPVVQNQISSQLQQTNPASGIITISDQNIDQFKIEMPGIQPNVNNVNIIVKDQQGKALSKVTCIVKDRDENPVRAGISNDFGQIINNVPLKKGTYKIQLTKEGYVFPIVNRVLEDKAYPTIEIKAL